MAGRGRQQQQGSRVRQRITTCLLGLTLTTAAATPTTKRANLWLSTADCCGHPGCGDLFDVPYGRSQGLETSYFEALRPWASTLDALLIDCGHRLTTSGALQLPNSTQMQRLRRTKDAFQALNVSVIPMIFADYDRADLGLDALSNSSSVSAAFIAAAVRDATANGWGGFNIDWEPCTGKTKARECGALGPAQKWPRIPAILGQLHDAMARAVGPRDSPGGSAATCNAMGGLRRTRAAVSAAARGDRNFAEKGGRLQPGACACVRRKAAPAG